MNYFVHSFRHANKSFKNWNLSYSDLIYAYEVSLLYQTKWYHTHWLHTQPDALLT